MRRHPMTTAATVLAALALVAAGLAGCSDSTSPGAASSGRLKLNLIDAPGDFEAVNVEVEGVQAHREYENGDGEWITVSTRHFTVDLLTLTRGHGVVVADTVLPAGQYTQVRLLLGDGCTVAVDGQTHPLEVPSGDTSGLKLNHPFTIAPQTLYEATLDFDAHRSIHTTGNGRWIMRPVIAIVLDAISGSLRGVALPAAARAAIWAVMGQDSSLAWADTLSGAFVFPMLREGTYDVTLAPTAGAWQDSTVTGITITVGAWTDLGTIELQEGAAP